MNDFPKLDECLLVHLGAGRWRLLGRRLRPLTLMHRELLRMAGNPLITGLPMRLPDLDQVVQVCRRTPRQAACWLARPRGRWHTRLRMAWLLAAYGWRLGPQWKTLRAWCDSCDSQPEMLDRPPEAGKEKPSVTMGRPVFQRDAPLVLDLWSTLAAAGYPAREVVEEWPAGLARWLSETLGSRDGGRKFITEADREMMEEARRVREITEPAPLPEEEVQEKARAMMRSLRPKAPSTVDG